MPFLSVIGASFSVAAAPLMPNIFFKISIFLSLVSLVTHLIYKDNSKFNLFSFASNQPNGNKRTGKWKMINSNAIKCRSNEIDFKFSYQNVFFSSCSNFFPIIASLLQRILQTSRWMQPMIHTKVNRLFFPLWNEISRTK